MYNARERSTIGMLKSGEVLGETKATETISTVKNSEQVLDTTYMSSAQREMIKKRREENKKKTSQAISKARKDKFKAREIANVEFENVEDKGEATKDR